MNIIEEIKNKRKQQGYNQIKFAKLIGISVSQYSAFERGVRNLSFDKFMRMVDILGTELLIVDRRYDTYQKIEGETMTVYHKVYKGTE